MSTLSKINAVLNTPVDEKAVAVLEPGVLAVQLKKDAGSLSQQFEIRAVMRALQPLVEQGWSVQPGATDFRSGAIAEIIVREPVEKIDTAALPLLDRVRVDADVLRPKTFTRAPRRAGQNGPSERVHTGYGSDWLDEVEVDEGTRAVVFSSVGVEKHIAVKMERVAGELRRAGWQVTVSRFVRGDGFTARCVAPEVGQRRTRSQIEARTGK